MANQNVQNVQVIPSSLANWCQVARGSITAGAADIRLQRKEQALDAIKQAKLALMAIEDIAKQL